MNKDAWPGGICPLIEADDGFNIEGWFGLTRGIDWNGDKSWEGSRLL